MTDKILGAHGVTGGPGTFALVRVDRLMLNDVSGAVAIREFEQMGADQVFDVDRVSCVADHFWPAKDVRSAHQISTLRAFAQAHGIQDYWEVGATVEAGIEHALLAEQGRIRPGDFVVGGDSHTCTSGAFGAFATGVGSTDIASVLALGHLWIKVPEAHRIQFTGEPSEFVTGKDLVLAYLQRAEVDGGTYASLEFVGDGVERLSMDDRMALCNMTAEAGAKTGMIGSDRTTVEWLTARGIADPPLLAADPNAAYADEIVIDLDGMPPLVASPASPGNVGSVREIPPGTHVDQVYVGNCANGSLSDLRQLARVVGGRKVASGTRLIVVPATQRIYREALAEGTVTTLLEAGAMLSPPTCGACFGGHMGILDTDEVAVATTNRNYIGRMGDRTSQVYLANAYVAGAAAVTGKLCDPRDVLDASPTSESRS